MRTFVADSDDDGDDLESDSSNRSPPSRPKLKSAAAAQQALGLSAPPSDRYRATDQPLDEEGHFTMPSAKRRKTGPEPQSSLSPNKRARRNKTITTYSKKQQQQQQRRTEFLQESEQLVHSQESALFNSSNTPQSSNANQTERDAAATNGAWDLAGSLQHDFALHDPNAMFPEQSSTIPDNTATQRKLVEDAIDAMRPPHVVEVSLTDQTTQKTNESPIPWSDYIKTPSDITKTPSQQHTTEHTAGEEMEIDARPQGIEQPQVLIEPRAEINDTSPKLRTSGKKPKRTTKPVAADSDTDPLNSNEIAIGLPKERYKPRPSRSRSLRVIENEPTVVATSSQRPSGASRRKTTNGVIQPSSSEKVETICGMGFSASQARKALDRHDGSVDDAVLSLCDPKPSQSQQLAPDDADESLRNLSHPSERDVEHEYGVSVARKTMQRSEVAEKSSPKAKSTPTRKKSRAVQDSEDEEDSPATDKSSAAPDPVVDLDVKDNHTSADKTDVAADESAPKTNGKDAKLKKNRGRPRKERATEDVAAAEPSNDQDKMEPVDSVEQTKGAAKKGKGRGRPRKRSEAIIHDESDVEAADASDKGKQVPALDAEVDTKESDSAHPKSLSSPRNEARADSEKANPPPATPPLQRAASDSSTTKGAAAPPHSPLSKGKVPYRVGLSRRSRIAPLLRIIKK